MIDDLFEILKKYSDFCEITTRVMEFREEIFKYNIVLTKLDSTQLRSLLEQLPDYNHNEQIMVYINDYPLNSNTKYDENVENKLSITITQKYLPPNNEKIILYSIKDFSGFEKQFLDCCNFEDMKFRKQKILVEFADHSAIDTPIFSTAISQELSISKVLTENENFCNVKLFAMPGLINSSNLSIYGEEAIFQILGILSEKNISKTDFIISFNRNSILNRSRISLDENLFNNIYQIMEFLFREPEKYYERLVMFRDLFSKVVSKKQSISSEDFKNLYIEIQTNYNLFITDKLATYLEDKKKIAEEYTRIHREIVESIRRIISDLTQQIMVLLGAVLSFWLFDGLDNVAKVLIFAIVVFIYLSCVYFFNWKKGWNFESISISKEKKRFKEMYELLYSVEKSFIKILDEEFDDSLENLKKIEKLSKMIIEVLLLIVFLMFLWA